MREICINSQNHKKSNTWWIELFVAQWLSQCPEFNIFPKIQYFSSQRASMPLLGHPRVLFTSMHSARYPLLTMGAKARWCRRSFVTTKFAFNVEGKGWKLSHEDIPQSVELMEENHRHQVSLWLFSCAGILFLVVSCWGFARCAKALSPSNGFVSVQIVWVWAINFWAKAFVLKLT